MLIGERLGLQQNDPPGVGVLDTELRLRLWWQICISETQHKEVAAHGSPRRNVLGDARMPLNLSDVDLHHDLQSLPTQREAATEMMFCR